MTELAKLAIRSINKETEDGVMTVHRLHIQGQDNDAKKVIFRPYKLVNKLIKMEKGSDGWKVTGETVMFEDFFGDIPDSNGGQALGKLFGKKKDALSKEDQEKNKNLATFYGFLFGMVQFEGEDWKLCNFRLTGGKTKQLGDALRSEKDKAKWPLMEFEISVKPGQRPQFADLVISKKDTQGSTEGVTENLKAIDAFIADHNQKVIDFASRKANGGVSNTEVVKDLDDEIPF